MSGTESEFVSDVGGPLSGVCVRRLAVPGGYLYLTFYNKTVTSCFVPCINASRTVRLK